MTQPAHGWRSHYALLILLFVYTMSFIDRQIMGILVQPIKQEFGVSDTAMGVLTGVTFALFYSTLAIPFGRYADRANRRNFVAYCCAAWSAGCCHGMGAERAFKMRATSACLVWHW